MSFLNTLNTPKLLEEDGVIKFLPVIYAQQYEIEYRYIDETGKIQNSGSLTIDYDSRANGIGNDTFFDYVGDLQKFLNNYNVDLNINSHNSKYYTSGFLILNTDKVSSYKPFTLSTARSILPILPKNKITKIGIQEVITYFEADKNLTKINMRYNGSITANELFQNFIPDWSGVSYIRYCFNAVNLSIYMNNLQYNSVRIKAKNGRFPSWYSSKYDSSWSNWFYINYKPNEILLETYINKAENNMLYKNSHLEFKGIITGIFRNDITITNPDIEIESNTIPNFNYIYIREFDRFYFVNNVTVNENKLYTLHCSVDVLMSFRHFIDLQEVILSRSSCKFNNKLIDDFIPAELDYSISKVNSNINTNKYDELIYNCGTTTDFQTFSVVVATDDNISNTKGQFNKLSPSSKLYFLDKYTLSSLVSKLYEINIIDSFKNLFQNLCDGIISIKKVPFHIGDDTRYMYSPSENKQIRAKYVEKSLHIGKLDETGISASVLKPLDDVGNSYVLLRYGGTIDTNIIERNNFYDYEPYTSYLLFIPFVGYVEISGKKILSSRYIHLYYICDMYDGSSLCVVTSSDNDLKNIAENSGYIGEPIYTCDCVLGIDIPISNTNVQDISKGIVTTAIGVATSAVKLSSSVSALSATQELLESKKTSRTTPKTKLGMKIEGVKREKTKSIIQGVSNIASGSLINTVSNITLKQSVGNMSHSLPLNISLGYFSLYIYKQKIPKDYENYVKVIGKPSSFIGTINSLDGYNKISELHLSNFDNITTEELEEIEDILLSGIFIGSRKF